MSRHLLVLIFEPIVGFQGEAAQALRDARRRAATAGWNCWAYRNQLRADEITLFLEGPAVEGDPPVFGDEIERIKSLAARFEPVRSLIEYPLEDPRYDRA